ncbi:LPS-assembly protein LptD @ Organic solvent tolerance protein precursor [hydrothermal vent metagenome]|uniref:LPS-assembly protein LptD @ Organic solvent tolerance protein n=1 Tax=hydrothermal vent metagenome TaxID=652676 RepID=A0A3B1B8Q0_9ZZZZ
MHQRLFLSSLCLFIGLPSLLYAQTKSGGLAAIMPDKESLCGKPAPWPRIPFFAEQATHIQADKMEMPSRDLTIFTGRVILNQANTQVETDRARYFRKKNEIEAQGNVHLTNPGLQLKGSDARYNMSRQNGIINHARYLTIDGKRGHADSIKLLGPARMALDTATYTSCKKEDPDWLLTASSLHLDTKSRQGYATNSVVSFKGVPFFYFPYMRFPIGDARLTGLLFPDIGSSQRNGTQVILPFYWNIAPHRDATITPWYMSRRGTLLQNEFRYLNPGNSGQLALDYLNNDKLYGSSRSRIKWQHRSTAVRGWATEIDYNQVSDNDYFLDFGTNLNKANLTQLQQKAALSYNALNWSIRAQAQAYQTLSGSGAYERLPQLTFRSRLPQRENKWHPGVNAEFVKFARKDNGVLGTRLNIKPYISLPLRNEAMFLTPKLSWQFTAYDLLNPAQGQPAKTSRNLPIFSLNSGIFFERNLGLGGHAMTQTLEPQLFYVYSPYRQQDNLPLFDTGQVVFNINDPFRENRFTGADRVEDANRLTAMLTTRFFDESSGTEKLMARIGQMYYFSARRVALSGNAVDTTRRTPVIAELMSRPFDNLYIVADTQWDPQTKTYTRGNLRIDYKPTHYLDFRINYRYQKNSLATNEGMLRWRITPNWYIGARRLYDARNQRQQESEYSLRYDSCCWAFKLSSRQRFIRVGEPEEKAVYFELVLKGLAGFGSGF